MINVFLHSTQSHHPIISPSHFITPHQLDLNLCEANILSTYNIRLKYELKRSFSISTFHSLIQHNLCSWWACNQNKTQNLNFELFNQFRFWHTQKFFSCPNALYFHYFLIPVVCCFFLCFIFFYFWIPFIHPKISLLWNFCSVWYVRYWIKRNWSICSYIFNQLWLTSAWIFNEHGTIQLSYVHAYISIIYKWFFYSKIETICEKFLARFPIV